MANEKKPDFGKYVASFKVDITGDGQSNIFFTVNKFRSPGKYQPIYKSECKGKNRKTYEFNKLTIDTDTLCENDDDQEIFI